MINKFIKKQGQHPAFLYIKLNHLKSQKSQKSQSIKKYMLLCPQGDNACQ